MKELSVEEKAKRYDEALKVLHKYDGAHIMFTQDLKEEMFPELKEESEDEMTRKALINGFNKLDKSAVWYNGITNGQILAWLEKQGEQKPIDPVAIMKDYFANTPKEQQEKDWAELKHLNDVGFDIDIPFGAKDSELQEVSYYIPEGFYTEIEGNKVIIKQGEQKTADNVELRQEELTEFEKAVKQVMEEAIECGDTHNLKADADMLLRLAQKPAWSDEDEDIINHLLTICAEPKFHKGEWLCENEPNNYARFIQILETVNVQGKERYRILRDIHNDEDIVEFGFVEKYYHKFDIKDAKDGDVLHCWIDGYEFVLIYKSIKDGYITTYGHLYQNLKSFSEEPTTMFCRTIQGHFTPATKEQREQLEKVMADAGYKWNKEERKLEKIEQKPAWSEEDDEHLSNAIFFVREYQIPTRDKKLLEAAKKAEEWLKSLRPQNRWKPSDEQMKCLDNVKGSDDHNGYILNTLYNELKKLKD